MIYNRFLFKPRFIPGPSVGLMRPKLIFENTNYFLFRAIFSIQMWVVLDLRLNLGLNGANLFFQIGDLSRYSRWIFRMILFFRIMHNRFLFRFRFSPGPSVGPMRPKVIFENSNYFLFRTIFSIQTSGWFWASGSIWAWNALIYFVWFGIFQVHFKMILFFRMMHNRFLFSLRLSPEPSLGLMGPKLIFQNRNIIFCSRRLSQSKYVGGFGP